MNPIWKKIAWAVDVFADPAFQCPAKSALRRILGDADVPVEPVYVLNRAPARMRRELPRETTEQLERSAREKFGRMCEGLSLSNLLPLKVLTGAFTSRAAGVQALLRDAIDGGSELIVASTRARSGPARWLTGSFVETLMLESTLPLLVVNPHWQDVKPELGEEEILFPTDFSEESREAYGEALALALRMKIRVTIFHKIPFLLTPVYELAGYPIYNEVYQSQIDYAESTGKQWIENARERGVSARMKIQTHLAGTAAEAILELAESGNYLIVMAARSGPFVAALLGSTTREVVRGASSPVWIVHPKSEALEPPVHKLSG